MRNYPDVINLHFTDFCNFRCSYCFVNKKAQNTLSWENIELVLQNIQKYFRESVQGKGRINLVGGEPMTYSRIQELIDRVCELGMDCSMVTNGSLLTKEFIDHNKNKLSTIGISIDSLSDTSNRRIGRCDATGKTISEDEMIQRCRWIRESGITLKINTVYSKHNVKEDFRDFLKTVQPHRTKLFQMLIVKGVNDHASSKAISDAVFKRIAMRYVDLGVVIEDNDLMTNGYVIVNSNGELLDKEDQQEHVVGSLLFEDLKTLMDRSSIVEEKFNARYLTNEANRN